MKFIALLVESQVNIVVQPIDAESYEFPAGIAHECQTLANQKGKPVVLAGKNGDRCEFLPQNV